MHTRRVIQSGSVLAMCVLGCGPASGANVIDAPPGVTNTTPPPAPSVRPAPTASTTASAEPVVPAPAPDWEAAGVENARGYVSIYFGSGAFKDSGMLRPLAAWSRGESGVIRIFRRVDPQSGLPADIAPLAPERGGPTPKQLGDGVLWYEWPSDGVQFYWVTSRSIVLAVEESPLARGTQLWGELRDWALKVVVDLAAAP